jgi:DNA-binding transcriptional LysR family regulator
MDRFAALEAFVAVIEANGFAAAARSLGTSRSAINRQVIALEDTLQVQLLQRTTRSVSPTAAGAAFYDRAKAILAALREAEHEASEAHSTVIGRLRVAAPMSFGILHLSSAIADFMSANPGLTVEVSLSDRFVDIIEDGFDLAVRIGMPRDDSNLVDFRICDVRRVLCASPDFLARQGVPGAPTDLRRLPCLHYGDLPGEPFWRLVGPAGNVGVHANAVMSANNGEVLRDAAVKGLGICLLPTFIVGAELQAGRLVTVLPGYRPPQLTLAAVYPPMRRLSAKIRLFTDFLVERFGERPYWDLVE